MRALPDRSRNALAAAATDRVNQHRRKFLAIWIAMFGSVVRAQRGLKRCEEANEVRSFKVSVRISELFARDVIAVKKIWRRNKLPPQSIDRNTRRAILVLNILDVLVPVKTTVLHGRRWNRALD